MFGISTRKTIALLLFPRYWQRLDKLNWGARWMASVKAAAAMPLFRDRTELYSFVEREFCAGGPIEYLEFGVFQGDSIRCWCKVNQHPNSRFHGFDSFEGLPEDWSPAYPQGAFSTSGKTPEVGDPRVNFVAGWFQKTIPGWLISYRPDDKQLVIHCDSDLYSSTLFVLTSLDRIIRPGTVLIFDEFDAVLHEYKALSDYCVAYLRRYRIVAATEGFLQVAVVME
jgi:O-methyltransferase